ncbi:hypothetical protein [Sphingomonas sp. DBB INV C78]|uniref:hypothetical protein n=1 Tax=Sphingomonas sp. DBB INV C78 TaxID=3349434 RepID=UPI0036D336D5
MQSIFGPASTASQPHSVASPSHTSRMKPLAGIRKREGKGFSLWGTVGMAAVAALGISAIYLVPPEQKIGPIAQADRPVTEPIPLPEQLKPQPTFAPPATVEQPKPATQTSPVKQSSPTTKSSTTDKPARAISRGGSPVRTATVEPDAPSRSAPSARRCTGMDDAHEAWCLQPAVRAADQELRNAYASAIRNGVERSTLVSYRKRWSKVRNRSSDEPRQLIGNYYALAEELQTLSAQARRER